MKISHQPLRSRLLRRWQQRPKRKGSALMLMIWAVLFMAFTVAGVVTYMQNSLRESSEQANQFRAYCMAECGLGIALHPTVHVLKGIRPSSGEAMKNVEEAADVTGDAGFSLNKVREGSRLPLNYITDSNAREVFMNLFILWGLNNDEATTAVDSLADWVDGDSETRSQGAEADYYKAQGVYNLPRNQGFTSLEEMLLCRGFDVVARLRPDWRNYFSIYSDGTIDLFWASKDVIMALTGATDTDTMRLITARAGDDGIDGTDDDNRSLGQSAALTMLGIPAEKLSSLQARTTYARDNVFRIVSKGYVGTRSVTITLIARYADDQSLTYLARTEE